MWGHACDIKFWEPRVKPELGLQFSTLRSIDLIWTWPTIKICIKLWHMLLDISLSTHAGACFLLWNWTADGLWLKHSSYSSTKQDIRSARTPFPKSYDYPDMLQLWVSKPRILSLIMLRSSWLQLLKCKVSVCCKSYSHPSIDLVMLETDHESPGSYCWVHLAVHRHLCWTWPEHLVTSHNHHNHHNSHECRCLAQNGWPPQTQSSTSPGLRSHVPFLDSQSPSPSDHCPAMSIQV